MPHAFSRPARPSVPTSQSHLEIVTTDDGSKTIRDRKKLVTWHSESGAVAESKVVFVRNSNVLDHLKNRPKTRVLEIGFGTGLNFWLTASAAMRSGAALCYQAIEPDRLSTEIVHELGHGDIDACQPAYTAFAKEAFIGSDTKWRKQSVQLEVVKTIESLMPLKNNYDCIYHDPFAPDAVPGLWSVDYFRRLFRILAPSQRLVTYCVKSKIQKVLKDVGFELTKTPGPIGGKREVLIATKPLASTL